MPNYSLYISNLLQVTGLPANFPLAPATNVIFHSFVLTSQSPHYSSETLNPHGQRAEGLLSAAKPS